MDVKQTDKLYVTEPIFIDLWHISFIWVWEPPEVNKNHKSFESDMEAQVSHSNADLEKFRYATC